MSQIISNLCVSSESFFIRNTGEKTKELAEALRDYLLAEDASFQSLRVMLDTKTANIDRPRWFTVKPVSFMSQVIGQLPKSENIRVISYSTRPGAWFWESWFKDHDCPELRKSVSYSTMSFMQPTQTFRMRNYGENGWGMATQELYEKDVAPVLGWYSHAFEMTIGIPEGHSKLSEAEVETLTKATRKLDPYVLFYIGDTDEKGAVCGCGAAEVPASKLPKLLEALNELKQLSDSLGCQMTLSADFIPKFDNAMVAMKLLVEDGKVVARYFSV